MYIFVTSPLAISEIALNPPNQSVRGLFIWVLHCCLSTPAEMIFGVVFELSFGNCGIRLAPPSPSVLSEDDAPPEYHAFYQIFFPLLSRQSCAMLSLTRHPTWVCCLDAWFF